MSQSQKNTIDAYGQVGEYSSTPVPRNVRIAIETIQGIRDYEKNTALLAEKNREEYRRIHG